MVGPRITQTLPAKISPERLMAFEDRFRQYSGVLKDDAGNKYKAAMAMADDGEEEAQFQLGIHDHPDKVRKRINEDPKLLREVRHGFEHLSG